jgi:predicted glycosyltransferase involved in capsule biosynthesis
MVKEMNQQIIIPWRHMDCIYREKHFNFLFDYYSQEFDVVLADHEGDFNRSAARNAGVQQSSSEISVIIDADNYIPFNQIHDAIRVAARVDALVKPFKWFGYLTESSTDLFYETNELRLDFNPEYIQPPEKDFTGGAYVMKKKLWEKLGGMDEGFVGWGAEDDAFHLLCKNSGVKTRYVEGYDYHLFHPAHRVTSEFNYNKLITEYVDGNKSSRI